MRIPSESAFKKIKKYILHYSPEFEGLILIFNSSADKDSY